MWSLFVWGMYGDISRVAAGAALEGGRIRHANRGKREPKPSLTGSISFPSSHPSARVQLVYINVRLTGSISFSLSHASTRV